MSSATTSATSKPIPQLPGLPILGNALDFQRDRLELLGRVARECGEIGSFRIGPKSVVVITSAELVQELMVEKGEMIHRGPFFDTFIPVLGKHSLLTIGGTYHRQQRKLQMPAFGHRRMPKYAAAMMECIRQVVDELRDGQHVDLGEEMARLARLITAKTLFTIDEGPLVNHFQKAIFVVEQHMARMMSNVVPMPLWLPTSANHRARIAITEMRKRADEIIAEYRARNQDMGDLLSMLLQAQDENGAPLSDEQLRDHTVTMYIAGQETTAVGLTWMLIHMAKNPEVQAKARQEVDEALQGRNPTYEDLPQLPYCLQVVKEALRLSPRRCIRSGDVGGDEHR